MHTRTRAWYCRRRVDLLELREIVQDLGSSEECTFLLKTDGGIQPLDDTDVLDPEVHFEGPCTICVRLAPQGSSSRSQVSNWMKALEWLVDTVHTENLPQDDMPDGGGNPDSVVCAVM